MESIKDAIIQKHFEMYRDEMIMELRWSQQAINESKDILIVFHNQLEYLKNCIESIQQHTTNYKLYLWDNASNIEVKRYIRDLENTTIIYNDKNIGYGIPNNRLADLGNSKYLILLNSDTIVFPQWSEALLGYLQFHPECAQVGYLGGLLDEDGKGGRCIWGSKIDYVMGFCSCISRETYRQYGLFDHIYEFAYCEDSDYSLRLQSFGKKIHALHLMLVHHWKNKTIKSVMGEGKIDVNKTFKKNHDIFRLKWESYLKTNRIDVRNGET